MPYHVGNKGSNGCSGFPVVSDAGKVMGCHPTQSNAQEQVAALYAAGAADKADTPMDVAYNAVVTDPTPASPSSHINPNAGMKKPQYMVNQKRPTKSKTIHNKPGVDIWSGSAFGRQKSDVIKDDNAMMPTSTYQEPSYSGCGCDECLMSNMPCTSCSKCASELGKSIFNLNSAAKLITKQTVRWE